MSRPKLTVTAEVLDYVVRHGAQPDAVLAAVARETVLSGEPAIMQVQPDEGALLTFLARLVGARRALEVGTFMGYGAICIARGLADGGELLCLELSRDYATVAERNVHRAGLSDRVKIRVGPAADALRALPEAPRFDFAFLDADKLGYPEYYELIVPRLEPGGLLCVDNVLLSGDVVEPHEDDERGQAMDALNDRIAADERVDSVMLALADGLTLVRRR